MNFQNFSKYDANKQLELIKYCQNYVTAHFTARLYVKLSDDINSTAEFDNLLQFQDPNSNIVNVSVLPTSAVALSNNEYTIKFKFLIREITKQGVFINLVNLRRHNFADSNIDDTHKDDVQWYRFHDKTYLNVIQFSTKNIRSIDKYDAFAPIQWIKHVCQCIKQAANSSDQAVSEVAQHKTTRQIFAAVVALEQLPASIVNKIDTSIIKIEGPCIDSILQYDALHRIDATLVWKLVYDDNTILYFTRHINYNTETSTVEYLDEDLFRFVETDIDIENKNRSVQISLDILDDDFEHDLRKYNNEWRGWGENECNDGLESEAIFYVIEHINKMVQLAVKTKQRINELFALLDIDKTCQ